MNNASARTRRAIWQLGIALVLLLAFGLRLWRLGAQSLWHDETWSIFSAYHPLATGMLGTDPNAPPLFYLSLGAWMQIAGDGVWTLRFWSLLIGVLTVAVGALISRRLLGRRAALIAAFLLAISPILWTFSQEIRAYELMPLYALLLLGLVDQLLRAPSRRVWLWLLLIEIAALYTQNLGVPLVAWLNVTVIGVWLYRQRWAFLRRWFIAQAVLAIAYLPWLISQRPTGTALNTPPPITLNTAVNIALSYFTGVKALLSEVTAHPVSYGPLWVGVIVLLAIAVAAFVLKIVRPARQTIRQQWTIPTQTLILSQVCLLPAFSLVELYAAHIDFHPRYFILGAPSLLLFLAVGLADLSRRGRITGPLLTGSALLGAGAATIFALTYIAGDGRFQHDDFRAIAERYATLTADDAIVIPYNWEPTLDYYSHKMNFRAQIVGIPLGSDWQTIVSRLNAIHARRVELLTWYQLPADVRGAYACLLGAVTEAPPELFTVNGLSTLRYDQPGTITPLSLNGSQPAFGALTQGQTAIVANDQRACLISNWTASAAPGQMLGVNVQLNNPRGWPLGQASSDLRTDQQVPTQFWKDGQSGTSFSLIDFAPGLPAGDYPLLDSVYQSDTLRKLDMLDSSGAPAGQLAALGTATLTPADLMAPPTGAQVVSTHWQIAYSGRDSDPGRRCVLQPGQQWQISVLWWTDQPATQAQTAMLQAESDDWPGTQSAQQPVTIPANRHSALTWAAITIPASVSAPISLIAMAPDGSRKTIDHCQVKPADHLFSAPAMGTLYSASFPGVGTLVGFDGPASPLTHADFPLTLYWHAAAASPTAYTVFVHLLNASGQVIAQQDSPPTNGNRPTSGWVTNEFIADPHVLTFNAAGQQYSGAASIEIGLYDPITGQRVRVGNGADHVSLPAQITVK